MYIDINDFESMQKLAEYLKYVVTNETEFNKYHEYDIPSICENNWLVGGGKFHGLSESSRISSSGTESKNR